MDQVGFLKVFCCESREQMGMRAGTDAAAAIRRAIAEKGRANVMFAAAPSQNETLAVLCQADGIDWTKVTAFHMDEYIALPPDHPAGFGNFLRRAIFDRLPFASVHLIRGAAEDPAAEARRYAKLLAEHPLDVCLCGIGENGHLAFNDPPADFHDPQAVRCVTLDETCRMQQVHDGCFPALDQVPRQALTATVPVLLSAETVICSVPAASKAEAVRRMLRGEIAEDCPASVLRTHRCAGLYLDPDAASLL